MGSGIYNDPLLYGTVVEIECVDW